MKEMGESGGVILRKRKYNTVQRDKGASQMIMHTSKDLYKWEYICFRINELMGF